jgi:DNA-binding NarL/FixJ family response regulator
MTWWWMRFEPGQKASFVARNASVFYHNVSGWSMAGRSGSTANAFAGAAPLKLKSATGRRLLTKREEDVVKLVVEGYSNRDAAQKLDLAEHTVSNYPFEIYEKLGTSSRVELVLYSLPENRWVLRLQAICSGHRASGPPVNERFWFEILGIC